MANQLASLTDILNRYRDGGGSHAPGTVDEDFDHVAKHASPGDLRDGVAEAFRSDRTPEFPQMAAQMFGRANGAQRSQILSMLLSVVGPMVLNQILARRGQAGSAPSPQEQGRGGGGLGDILGSVFGGGHDRTAAPQVPADAAEKVDPGVVEDLAREAQKQDPSVLDRMSDVVAGQPHLLKVIGGAALAIALGRMASRRGTL